MTEEKEQADEVIVLLGAEFNLNAKPLNWECGEMKGISTLFDGSSISSSDVNLWGTTRLEIDIKTGRLQIIRRGFNKFPEDLKLINFDEPKGIFDFTAIC